MKYTTSSPAKTKKLAKIFAEEIIKTELKAEKAVIICLSGELGAGKTTFIQGFAQGLGIKKKIVSPTFVIARNYEVKNKNYNLLFHIDAYRIKNIQELKDLKFERYLKSSTNIFIIEWGEKITKLLPREKINILLEYGKNENERKIKIT